MSDQAVLSKRWRSRARLTAVKVNAASVLAAAAPWFAGLGAAGFAVILLLRSQGADLMTAFILPWLPAVPVLLIALTMIINRREFMSSDAALVRLESRLRLHNALTVARLGRGPWPEMPESPADGLGWRWFRAGGPMVMCLLCLWAALSLPVSREAVAEMPDAQPQSWSRMEDWLKKLKEERIVSPRSLDEMLSKVEELRRQPADKWFSHEILNAGDTLKEQMQHDMGMLGQRLEDTERSLGSLLEDGGKAATQDREKLLKEYSESLEALKSGSLPLHPDLLQELLKTDPGNPKGMSQEQLNQLRESLKGKAGTCEGLSGEFGRDRGFVGDGHGDDEPGQGPRDRMKTGPEQGGAGDGGIQRGPGVAPLMLSEEENDFGTHKNEGIQGGDYSRSQLGDLLGVQEGRHKVDKSPGAPSGAGAIRGSGQGGEQVWRETLTPEEKAVLKRVFK